MKVNVKQMQCNAIGIIKKYLIRVSECVLLTAIAEKGKILTFQNDNSNKNNIDQVNRKYNKTKKKYTYTYTYTQIRATRQK